MVRRPVSGPRRASLKSAPGTFAEPKSSARQRISCTRVSGMKCRKAFFGRRREGVPSWLSGKGLRLLNGPPAKASGAAGPGSARGSLSFGTGAYIHANSRSVKFSRARRSPAPAAPAKVEQPVRVVLHATEEGADPRVRPGRPVDGARADEDAQPGRQQRGRGEEPASVGACDVVASRAAPPGRHGSEDSRGGGPRARRLDARARRRGSPPSWCASP